jgi:hypothetical protein
MKASPTVALQFLTIPYVSMTLALACVRPRGARPRRVAAKRCPGRRLQLPKLLYVKGGPLDRRNGFWWLGGKALTKGEQAQAYVFYESSARLGEPACRSTDKRPPVGKLMPAATTSSTPSE